MRAGSLTQVKFLVQEITAAPNRTWRVNLGWRRANVCLWHCGDIHAARSNVWFDKCAADRLILKF